MIESKGYKITPIDGDLAVGRNAEVGGDVDIQGKARVAGSLKVEGFLDAPHIKGAAKGLFNSVEELTREYPNPRPGWFAIVLDATNKEMGILYKAENRGWVATTDEARPYEFIMDSINVFASKGEAVLFGTFATRKDANEVLVEYENIDHLEGLFSIPAATEEQAGVITSEDKKYLVKRITWNNDSNPSNMNDFVDVGVYDIKGERTRANDNLPILNTGGGHTFNARLTVLDSSITGSGEDDDKCITQVLSFSNRLGQGEVYIRTGKGSSLDNLTWENWSALQRNVNVGQVTSLRHLIDNGIYSGVWTATGETFVLVVINNYALAGESGVSKSISQFKYAVNQAGAISFSKRVKIGESAFTEWEIINKDEIEALAIEIDKESQARINSDTELLKRIQGTSDESSASYDPFKRYPTNFSSGGNAELIEALNSMHSTDSTRGIDGFWRLYIGKLAVEVNNVAIKYTNDTWVQTIKLPYKWYKSSNQFGLDSDGNYHIHTYYRIHKDGAWGEWIEVEEELKSAITAEENRAKAEETAIRKLITDLVGESPETLDTIHEISSWILNDKTGAAAMATQINQLNNSIEGLRDELGQEMEARTTADYIIKRDGVLFGGFSNRQSTADEVLINYQSINQQNTGAFSIPAATTTKAGVMTAKDKANLDGYGDAIRLNYEDIKSLNTNKAERSDAMQYDTLGVNVYADKAEIYGRSISGTPRTCDFPAATTEKAGVMSAVDKEKLDSIEIINDLATGGVDKALSAEMGKKLAVDMSESQSYIMGLKNGFKRYKIDIKQAHVAYPLVEPIKNGATIFDMYNVGNDNASASLVSATGEEQIIKPSWMPVKTNIEATAIKYAKVAPDFYFDIHAESLNDIKQRIEANQKDIKELSDAYVFPEKITEYTKIDENYNSVTTTYIGDRTADFRCKELREYVYTNNSTFTTAGQARVAFYDGTGNLISGIDISLNKKYVNNTKGAIFTSPTGAEKLTISVSNSGNIGSIIRLDEYLKVNGAEKSKNINVWVLGDSISATGYQTSIYPFDTNATARGGVGGWISRFLDRVSVRPLKWYNFAVGGAFLGGSATGGNTFSAQLETAIASFNNGDIDAPDILLVVGCTNDIDNTSHQVVTIPDGDTYDSYMEKTFMTRVENSIRILIPYDELDNSKIVVGMRHIVHRTGDLFPNCKFAFCTPPQSTKHNPVNQMRCVREMKWMASRLCIPVIDVWGEAQMPMFWDMLDADGTENHRFLDDRVHTYDSGKGSNAIGWQRQGEYIARRFSEIFANELNPHEL